MHELILIRGVPGAGKTTLAIHLRQTILKAKIEGVGDPAIFEADDFFNDRAIYKYDRRVIGAAHDYCFSRVARHLWLKRGPAIVANTFTRDWELKRYLELSKALKYPTRIIHTLGNFESEHNVPADQMASFRQRFWPNEQLEEIYKGDYENVTFQTYEPQAEHKGMVA